MDNRKTLDVMRCDFPGEWLLITDLEYDQWGNLKSGIVVRHSANQEEVYRKPSLEKPTATFFTGESTYTGIRSRFIRASQP